MRTHTCGDLRAEDEGRRVTLCGWLENFRHHGGVAFADIRDRYGRTQLALPAGSPSCITLSTCPAESVIRVTGAVRLRPEKDVNPDLATGEVEVVPQQVEVLNPAAALPFDPKDAAEVGTVPRLKHRYLEMRHPPLRDTLVFRHRMMRAVRDFLDARDFVEVETPLLTRSTPEGARDYIVPSRVHTGRFYSLPQSPQLFKQMLMVGGVDRYYQIARCLRDEDLRADRQPEFTQLDLEMSFADEAAVMELTEELFAEVFEKLLQVRLKRPFERLSVEEALRRYGTDTPDLRIPLEVLDVDDLARASGFGVFHKALDSGGAVRALCVPGALTRKTQEALAEKAVEFGAAGLVWLRLDSQNASGPLAKFLDAETLQEFRRRSSSLPATWLFVASDAETASRVLGRLRRHAAEAAGMQRPGETDFRFAWIVDWPMFERNDEGRLVTLHHPFTQPLPEHLDAVEEDPLSVRARSYDIVLNGWELGGGSVRNHKEDVQMRVLKALGFDEETARSRFGFLLDALKFGAPPHAGIAVGLDRVCALMLGFDSIRDVIAFPKTTSAICPLTMSPAHVEPEQLAELHILVEEQEASEDS